MSQKKIYLVKSLNSQVNTCYSFEQLELFPKIKKTYLISLEGFNSKSFHNLLIEINPGLILDTREYPNFFSIYESMSSAKESFIKSAIDYNVLSISKSNKKQDIWNFINDFKKTINLFFEKNPSSSAALIFATNHMKEFFLTHYSYLIERSISDISMQSIENITL